MKALMPAIVSGVGIVFLWLLPVLFRRRSEEHRNRELLRESLCQSKPDLEHDKTGIWPVYHQRLVGAAICFYGIYLATLTGTVTKFFLPGIGAVGGGAAAGAGIGAVTFFVLGTVGAVTGGAGVAVGLLAMTLIGGGVGAAGAAVGGMGFRTVTYPLVSPWFWVPVIILGIYVLLGARAKRKLATEALK